MKKITKRKICSPLLAVLPMIIYLVIYLLTAFTAGILIGMAAAITGKPVEEMNDTLLSSIINEISMGLAALCSVFIVKGYSKTSFRDVCHIKKFDISVPIMLFLFTWSAGELFDHLSGSILSNFMTVEPNSTPFTGAFGVVCIVIFAPIFEEIIFRFAGTEIPRGAYSMPLICIANGLYFAAMHSYNIQGLLNIILIGASIAYVYCKTRNIFYTMIAHALHNLLCLVPFGCFAYYEKNGFVLGNWYWLVINAVLLAVSVAYLIKVFRKKYTKNYFEADRERDFPQYISAEKDVQQQLIG